MPKKASQEQIIQFQKDYTILRTERKFTNDEIARRMELNAGNMSSYGLGRKNAGDAVIRRFYETFHHDLAAIDKNRQSGEDELMPKAEYSQELIKLLVTQNVNLILNFDRLVKSNVELAQKFKELEGMVKSLVQINTESQTVAG